MKTLTMREARRELSHLDELAEEHGEIVILRRGRPIVRVLPIQRVRPVPSTRELRASMRPMEVPSETLLRSERDER